MRGEDDPDFVWRELLSESPERIRRIWAKLDPAEREAAQRHLRKMCSGQGWLESQRHAARNALDQLETIVDDTDRNIPSNR